MAPVACPAGAPRWTRDIRWTFGFPARTRDSGRILPSHPPILEKSGWGIHSSGGQPTFRWLSWPRAARLKNSGHANSTGLDRHAGLLRSTRAGRSTLALVRAMCFPLALWTLFIRHFAAAVLKSREGSVGSSKLSLNLPVRLPLADL